MKQARRIPTQQDVKAASDALRDFMQGTMSAHPGTGAAFMAGWGRCLRYRLDDDLVDLADLPEVVADLLASFSASEILMVMGEALERAACEHLAGGNKSTACSLHHQAQTIAETVCDLEDLPHKCEN